MRLPPGIRGRYLLNFAPHHSNSDSKLRYSLCALLQKGLSINPLRLPKALSQCDSLEQLLAPLHRSAAQSQPAGSFPSSCVAHADPMTPAWQAYLQGVSSAVQSGTGDDAIALALCSAAALPDKDCHCEWDHYLNPHSDLLRTERSPELGIRHVVRLALNSPLVKRAVSRHILRHAALLAPSPTAPLPTPAALSALSARDCSWTAAAVRDHAYHTEIKLADYEYEYHSTRVSNWRRGPDTPPAWSSDHVSYDQLHGNEKRLYSFLATAAPHCSPRPPTYRADGSGCIVFIHERTYLGELYRLHGAVSPAHGITRPLRLLFAQEQRPAAQCCSLCGRDGHSAHACPTTQPDARDGTAAAAAMSDDAADDTASLPRRSRRACRDCYSLDHQQTCYTPPSQQRCRIAACGKVGHTSFRCPLYQTSWVPISPPATSHPPNPLPLATIAQQRGLPAKSWSSVVTGPAPVPIPQLFPALSATDFPALPGNNPPASAASPASSSVFSSTSSLPASPTSPASPSSPQSLSWESVSLLLQRQQEQFLQQLQQQAAVFQNQLLELQRSTAKQFDALQQLLFMPAKSATPTGWPAQPVEAYMQQAVDTRSPIPSQSLALAQSPPSPPVAQAAESFRGAILRDASNNNFGNTAPVHFSSSHCSAHPEGTTAPSASSTHPSHPAPAYSLPTASSLPSANR